MGKKKGYLARRESSFEQIDAMPADLRECVHEYGFAIVYTLVKYGIRDPRYIHEIVKEIWAGARQPGQRTFKSGAAATNVHNMLDWLLIQNGVDMNTKTLTRLLWSHNMVIVPNNYGDMSAAVQASMDTVKNFDMRLTKQRKHSLRLTAAMQAQAKTLWPHLFDDTAA